MGRLSTSAIHKSLKELSATFPSKCVLITPHYGTHEGNECKAVRLAGNPDNLNQPGILIIAGQHAMEENNPDICVEFAWDLCEERPHGGYDSATIGTLVLNTHIFIFPLVNPDGRMLFHLGDWDWRKNRNPNPGSSCEGVDNNRNYDFHWGSGIGTSTNPCSQVYKGVSPFSEPENNNVKWFLDNYPNIRYLVDLHSYGQLIAYPWGIPSLPMSSDDLDWYKDTGSRIQNAIQAVNGNAYGVASVVEGIYPVSADSIDYAYNRGVLSIAIETGDWWWHSDSEFHKLRMEISAGLTELIYIAFKKYTEDICPFAQTVRGTNLMQELPAMRKFRDANLTKSIAGRRYLRMLEDHKLEVLGLLADPELRKQAVDLLRRINRVVKTRDTKKPLTFKKELIDEIRQSLEKVKPKAKPRLKKAIREIKKELPFFEGKTITETLESLDKFHERKEK